MNLKVRSAAAGRIALFAQNLKKSTVLTRLLPAVHRLVSDASEHVRASLACVVNSLSKSIGREETIDRLLPIILILLRDEVSEVNCIYSIYSTHAVKLYVQHIIQYTYCY